MITRIHLLLGLALLVSSVTAGCAGKTTDGGTPDGGTMNGGTGPLATCGDSCTPTQVSDSCSSICTKMTATGCKGGKGSADCEKGCKDFAAPTTPDCSHFVLEYLRCLDSQTPTCANGDDPQYPGCDSQANDAKSCLPSGGKGGTPPSPPAIGGSGGSVGTDPQICPEIPRPVGSATCSGSGSAGGSDVDAASHCSTSCQDSNGNLWESDCQGATCTCTYNHAQTCTCAAPSIGSCASCCPGT